MNRKNLKYLIKSEAMLTETYRDKIIAMFNQFKSGECDVLVLDGPFQVLVLDENNEIVYGDESGIQKGGDTNENRNPQR